MLTVMCPPEANVWSTRPFASIFALDPGTTETGWVHYVSLPEERIVLASGIDPNAALLERLRDGWSRIDHASLAIEMIASYGMPVGREVFETCVWIGRFIEAWGGKNYRLVYRREVKSHLCGSQKAKDANVWQAIVDKFGGSTAIGKKASPGPLYGVKSHARAALGVAITAAETKWERA